MPEIPAFLANVFEPRLARPVHVSSVVDLAPTLRRVRFQGDALQGAPFRPGQEIEFRVSERAFRHYTPASFDPVDGTLDVVFHVHGLGPGALWARSLTRGKRVNLLGPRGNFGLREARLSVFLGDETALGVFACLAQAASHPVCGAIELENSCSEWPQAVGLSLRGIARQPTRGDALIEWVRAAALDPAGDTCFYLVGHAASIARLRAELLSAGWSKHRIRIKPYWADGKRGL